MTEEHPLVEDLRQLIAGQHVVVVVGSGVSLATTNGAATASWLGLLVSGIEHCVKYVPGATPRWGKRQRDALTDALADGDLVELLSVAEQLTQRLQAPQGGEYIRWLRESIGHGNGNPVLPVADDAVILALHELGAPIVTTNYDDLIERVTDRPGVTWKDRHKITRIVRREDPDILHLHGKWDAPDSVILGIRNYESIRNDEHTQAVMQAFGFANSLLFVGCGEGLNDPNFGNLLQWMRRVKASDEYRSYRLALNSEVDDLQAQHPPEQRVLVLPCGEQHSDLPGFLESLIPANGDGSPTTVVRASLSPELDAYLQQLCTDHARLTMIGLGSSLPLDLSIDDAYVPLRTCHTPETTDQGRFDTQAFREAERMDRDVHLEHVFKTAGRSERRGALLLGDPGAGKTTGARQVCWRLASGRDAAEDLGLPMGTLPVFFRLRNLQPDNTGQNVREFLQAVRRTAAGDSTDDSDGLLSALWDHNGPLLWIFDGLDEIVSETDRATACARISELLATRSRKRQQDRVLVTSRYQGYIGKVDLGDDFERFEVQPLDENQSGIFVHKWYRTAYERLGLDAGDATDKARNLGELLGAPAWRVGRMPKLRSNPLLLTILCLVFHEDDNLPRSRVRLYERCVKVMLETWRGQVYTQQGGRPYSPNAARDVLASVAWWMHEENDRRSVPLSDMEDRAAQALRLYPNSGLGGDGAEFIRLMREDSGIVAASGSGMAEFLHLTFQEYLAALHAVQDGQAAQLAGGIAESWWQEVILLALAQGTPEFSESFFEALLKHKALEEQAGFVDRCLREAEPFVVTPFIQQLTHTRTTQKRRVTLLRHLRSFKFSELVDVCRGWTDSPNKELATLSREIVSRAGDAVDVTTEVEVGEWIEPVTGIAFVRIAAGTFRMGDERWGQSKPLRDVTLTQDFSLGKYPVTNEEYGRFLESTGHAEPSEWTSRQFNQPQQPVVGVSWDDAQAFCQWANCRLPTEAESEYACRAGTTTAFSFGDDKDKLGEHAWFDKNSNGQTQPVDSKRPHPWGLYDMHGNVYEWCQDWCGSNYYKSSPAEDPPGSDSSPNDWRVLRGGCWVRAGVRAGSGYRDAYAPARRNRYYGFRVLRAPSSGQAN